MDKALKYWPVAVAVVAIISSFVTAQIRIELNKAEIADLSESVDEMEDWIDELFYLIDG